MGVICNIVVISLLSTMFFMSFIYFIQPMDTKFTSVARVLEVKHLPCSGYYLIDGRTLPNYGVAQDLHRSFSPSILLDMADSCSYPQSSCKQLRSYKGLMHIHQLKKKRNSSQHELTKHLTVNPLLYYCSFPLLQYVSFPVQ